MQIELLNFLFQNWTAVLYLKKVPIPGIPTFLLQKKKLFLAKFLALKLAQVLVPK